MRKILIVDDDPILCRSLKKALVRSGYSVESCEKGLDALKWIRKYSNINLVLLDMKLPDISGLEIIRKIKAEYIKIPIIMITAYGTEESVIEAIKAGAYDYIHKPFDLNELETIVAKGISDFQLINEAAPINYKQPDITCDRIIGKSRKMQLIFKTIGQVSGTDISIIIKGESGTGKELVAKAIHQHSNRKNQPLLAINCAAIPESLLESELFGHEKGSFTGANKRRLGKFEQSHKGTILLDEIGDMPINTQSKILRVLQDGEFQRIGGNERIKVDVRVIAATNKPLEKYVQDGRFREDLYYRLNTVTINLPPLRERMEDIPDLTNYYFNLFTKQFDCNVRMLDPSVISKFNEYNWPGNIRELASTIQRGIVLAKGEVLYPEHIVLSSNDSKTHLSIGSKDELGTLEEDVVRFIRKKIEAGGGNDLYDDIMNYMEKILLKTILENMQENQFQAANILGISRNMLRDRIKKYNL
jgi:nitrogen regulation protein NR(I)